MSADDCKAHLLRELDGTACRCGRTKQPRQTFCRGCYYSLPVPTRRALYRRFGKGYEEAYAAAAEHLDARRAS